MKHETDNCESTCTLVLVLVLILLIVHCKIHVPVSYTHLDVYKRQELEKC